MMRRLHAIVLSLVIGAGVAGGHGGQFRGPSGGVPPGLREPFDAEPPPPPPSDPPDPDRPITPGENPEVPITPPEHGDGPETGGPPPDVRPPRPDVRRKGPNTGSLTFESWRFWWAYNNDDIISVRSDRTSGGQTSNPLHFTSRSDATNRRPVRRAARRTVESTILPALRDAIDRPGEHEDVHGGALIALAKCGRASHVPLFDAVLKGVYRNRKDRPVRFGLQATESAALAPGLLPDLDAPGHIAVRRLCLETIRDDRLRTRERAWAAIALGLQRDREAVQPLVELLDRRHDYPDDNVPAAILAALGLIGDEAVLDDLLSGFLHGKLYGRDVGSNDRLRAFAGYAIAKIGDPCALPEILKVLRSRSRGHIVKRSAAIAAGVLGARADAAGRKEAVAALLRYLRTARGDPSGQNFAIIALSQIGTEKALRHLLELAENGRYGQRPFAALGLGTHVFYRRRAAEEGRGEPMDPELEHRIRDKLATLSDRVKDSDTRAAMMLARGLVRDRSALDELVRIVSKKSAAPELRAHCCVALGLLGDARAEVKDALRLALRERTSMDLRRSAATGLGLLRDAGFVDLLLDQLERAKSFAVQGQVITAIGTIGDVRAVPALARLLEDQGQPAATRAMAAVGLGMIGDVRAVPALARLSKDYNYRASVRDLDELLYIL
jgi:HEAT repeat protein